MTTEPSIETATSRNALSAGIASVILSILFFTPWVGQFILYGSIAFGIIGVVLGIIALKKRQPKGMATIGIVLGAFSALFGTALILWAFAFVGVFSGN